VTADGRLVRADAASEPDLFWALRGGGGSFGVVTAVELRLFPVTEVYAGLLWWPADAASQVLPAWRELTHSGLPDAFTTTARLMNFPPLPEIPGQIRGRSFAVIDVIHLGAPAKADALLAPLRALGPVMDTIGMIPVPALGHLHMDPEHPVPAKGDGLLLASLPAQAIDQLIKAAGPGTGSPLLVAELRHLGGEFARPRPGNGALAAIDADYALFAAGIAPTPEAAQAVAAGVAAVQSALAPWTARQMYLNFAETSRDPASFWSPHTYDRLRRIKAAVDPHNMIRANHPIPPADR
jgi:FAD/FMN-containing dehydrogenase